MEEADAIAIVFEAPATCPDREAFIADVESRSPLVRVAKGSGGGRRYEVGVAARGGRFEGQLVAFDGARATEPHRVDGPACETVLAALSLTVALSIDPEAKLEASPALTAKASRAPDCPPAADVPRPPLPTAASRPPAARPGGPSVSVGAELRANGLPTVGWLSIATAVRGARHVPWLLLAPEASLGESERAAFVGVALRAETCPWELASGPVGLAPCLGTAGGFLRASGRDVVSPATVTAGTLSFRPGARVALEVAPLLLEAFGGLDLHAVRPSFVIGPGSAVDAETQPVGGGGGLSVGVVLR